MSTPDKYAPNHFSPRYNHPVSYARARMIQLVRRMPRAHFAGSLARVKKNQGSPVSAGAGEGLEPYELYALYEELKLRSYDFALYGTELPWYW